MACSWKGVVVARAAAWIEIEKESLSSAGELLRHAPMGGGIIFGRFFHGIPLQIVVESIGGSNTLVAYYVLSYLFWTPVFNFR